MSQRYADTGGYSITPLGAGPSSEHHLYGPQAGSNHPPDPQLSSLLFAGQPVGYPATPAALMGGQMLGLGDNDSEQLKQQREAIYGHPLFPMLTVLFQKCELATCTPREPAREGDQVDMLNVCSAASFNQDLEEFARTVQMNKPYYVPNPELDSLMINSIQVLRYHLLELEKVHELCDNFCAKYVNKIKERTQMDIIAGEQPPPPMEQHQQTNRAAQGMAGPMPSPGTASSSSLMEQQQIQQQQQHYGTPTGPQPQYGQQEQQMGGHLEPQPTSSGPQQQQQLGFLDLNPSAASANAALLLDQQHSSNASLQHFYAVQQQMAAINEQQQQEMAPIGLGKSAKRARKCANSQSSCATAQQQQHEGLALNPSPDTTARTDSASGSRSSTAAATMDEPQLQQQLGAANCNGNGQQQQNNSSSLDGLDETGGEDGLSFNDDSLGEERSSASPDSEQKPHLNGENGSGTNGQKRKVPKVFSKEAICKFRAWLFNNITHPYPAEEQKRQLAAETGLTILQVNNWFINARRRIVQPMIDSNNRAGRPVSVFKNRRRKSSGGNGTATPSPGPDGGGQSPEANGGSGPGGPVAANASPDQAASLANGCSSSAVTNSGGSSSSTSSSIGGSAALHQQIQPVEPLLSFPSSLSSMPTNPYQAAAAVAAAVSSNPYTNFGGAFPFAAAGMGGMSAAAAMAMPYGLNSMSGGGGWTTMDLAGQQAHRGGGLD